MTDDPARRLLDLARRVAEGRDVDWEREAGLTADHAVTLRGLSRLASLQAGFSRALETSARSGPQRPEIAGDLPPFQWGHLEVRERLGGGTYAEVYRAYDPLLDREVALKLLRRDSAGLPSWVMEARRLARVRHPGVVVVHGVDVFENRPGLWTDLVRGTTLEERLAATGPVAVEEACQIGIELCRALAAVHAAGIVHGDIKAANVLREIGGRVVLTDFGAATEPSGQPFQTEVATPLSMAPELFDGAPPSSASDIYALGVLLFRLATGRYPIEADSLEELQARHGQGGWHASPMVRPPMPEQFRQALDQALEARPEARIDNARAFERLLITALSTLGARDGAVPSFAAGAAPPRFPVTEQLLGREAELMSLKSEFHRSMTGAGFPLIVHGDPGVGKSFLAGHFQRWAEAQGALVLYTRIHEEDAGLRPSYQEFFDALLAVADREPDWLELSGLLAPARSADLSPLSPESIGQVLVQLSRKRTLVLVFDDLQWANDGWRDLVGYLMRCTDGESIMLLGLSRSEILTEAAHPAARWLRRQAGRRRFTSLPLEPFDEARFGTVLQALVPGPAGTSDIPPGEVRRLYELSGGNPYFLVELLRLLSMRGTLVWEEQPVPGWRWRRGGQWRPPDSLMMATRAELAALPAAALQVLQGAAVLGDEFPLATVERLLQMPRPELEALLEQATQNQLLTRRGLSPGFDYGFRHSLVREVILEDLAPGRRRRLHAAAVDALLATNSGDRDSIAAALSWHCEAAGDASQTLSWSMAAWRQARLSEQWSEGMNLLERAGQALTDAPESNPVKLEMLLGVAEAAWHLGLLKRSRECADAALELARRMGERQPEAAALLQQARTAVAIGDYQAAESVADAAAARFEALEDSEGVAQSHLQLAAAGIALGKYRSAARAVRQISARGGEAGTVDAAHGLLGWSLALQGRFGEALPLLRMAVAGAERLGDMRELTVRLRWLHWVHLSIGQYESAYQLALQAYERARRADDAYDEAKAIMGMGQARLGQGLCGEAIAYLRRTLEKLQQMGAPHREAETLWLLGRASCEHRQFAAARDQISQALAMVREIGDRDDEFRFLVDLGRVELAAGRPEAALDPVTRAAAIATDLGSRDGLGMCRAERANALLALGRAPEALQEARAAVALLDETGSAARWRGYWALARALRTAGEEEERRTAAIDTLRLAVGLLDEIRDQLPEEHFLRRREATLLFSGPARELADLLNGIGQAEEAASLARTWDLSVA